MPHLIAQMRERMNSLLLMHVRHAIKTGLACLLAYTASEMLESPYGVWAVVTTIVAMQGLSVADSLQSSLQRFTGMGLGALVGMLLLLLTPHNSYLLGVKLLLLTSLGAYLTRYGVRYMLASTAACILLLVGQNAVGDGLASPLQFGLMLVWEVAIGAFAALLVTFCLWPVRLADTLRSNIDNQLLRCADLLDEVINAYINEQQHVSYGMFETLSEQTRANYDHLSKIRKTESYFYSYSLREMQLQVEVIDRCAEGVRTLLDALNEYDEDASDPLMGKELRNLGTSLVEALKVLAAEDTALHASEHIREMTRNVDLAESKLTSLRGTPEFQAMPLHRALQLYTFYQGLRQLAEDMVSAMYEIQSMYTDKE